MLIAFFCEIKEKIEWIKNGFLCLREKSLSFCDVEHIEKDHRKGGFFRQSKRVCAIAEI